MMTTCEEIGCTALYIGPLFESVGHGYETTDYKKLDSRLGTNEDLKNFVAACHEKEIKVIFDGVFNHTGRDFFAFKDIQQNREHSRYLNWYCNVNFGGNTEYNDGFSYENWGGYNLLVKLNQRNPEVQNYICDVIRFWVSEFDVDGIRLDAADVLDFDFMRALRRTAAEVKEDFWLMGEVIHGDYSRWVNGETLHSVTNYALHKALYSGHNDHNYFEIAHTVKYLQNMGNLDLYNFVDNHDVERIYTKLSNKAHFAPVHVLLYTLPGVPSIYYGSEFGIEGKKEKVVNPNYQAGSEDWKTNRNVAEYTSSSLTTQHSHVFKYGRFEVRAKLPSAEGSWPAIWTLGNTWDWPMNGEIDIMECYLVNGKRNILANACWSSPQQWVAVWNRSTTLLTHFIDRDADWMNKYHVWRMDWDASKICIYLDGELLNEINSSETQNQGWNGNTENPFSNDIDGFGHYILLNLAIGGNGGDPSNSLFPMRYEVDYVRVYQKK